MTANNVNHGLIDEWYPNPNKPKYNPPAVYTHNSWLGDRAKERGITIAEYERRQKVLRDHLNGAKIYVNGTVWPTDEAYMKSHGECKVLRVMYNYNDFSKDEAWPASDNPLSVEVASKATGDIFWATPNFFTTVKPVEETKQC